MSKDENGALDFFFLWIAHVDSLQIILTNIRLANAMPTARAGQCCGMISVWWETDVIQFNLLFFNTRVVKSYFFK